MTDKKKQKWQQICDQLNSQFGACYSVENCKDKWSNHKRSFKDCRANETTQMFRTGNVKKPTDKRMGDEEINF